MICKAVQPERPFAILPFSLYLCIITEKRMLFTTHLLLCLAFGAKHIFADGGGAPNADKPQVDVKTADSDQGQRVPEETVQGKSITSTQSTQIVTSTLVLLFPGSSSSNSPSPESSRPTSPMPEPTAKKPNDVFCGTSGTYFFSIRQH